MPITARSADGKSRIVEGSGTLWLWAALTVSLVWKFSV
jgi:hypothetical protein